MSHKTKLITTIISIAVIIGLLGFGIFVSLVDFNYKWNSQVNLEYIPQEIDLTFQGKINGVEKFTSTAEEGVFNNPSWTISQEDTTFSMDKTQIALSFKFTNNSHSKLLIQVSGILVDRYERFSTKARTENGWLSLEEEGGAYSIRNLELLGNQEIEVTLLYTLEKYNVEVEGNDQDTQHLSIRIELA